MENKKISKKKRKQMNNMRNTIMMVLVTVLMLSTATFAWFTLSDNAKVTGMSLTAGASGGLLIGETTTTYGSILDLGMTDAETLAPATTKSGLDYTADKKLKLYKPLYLPNDKATINNMKELTNNKGLTEDGDADKTYYYEKTFYLKAPGDAGNTTPIYFQTGKKDDGVGTYIIDNAPANQPSAALRIALTIKGETVVYEPNTNLTFTGSSANTTGVDMTQYGFKGTRQQPTGDGVVGDGSSIFTLNNGEDTEVTMQVWFEGTDNQCVNEISAKNLQAQIGFTTESK